MIPSLPPRELPPSNGSIEPLPKGAPDPLFALYDLDGLALALGAMEFELLEEVDFLVSIMRDTTRDTSHRLAAHRSLRALLKEVMNANGLFAKAQESKTTQAKDGTITKRVVSSETMISRFRKDLSHAPSTQSLSGKLIRPNGTASLPAGNPPPPSTPGDSPGEAGSVGGEGGGGSGSPPP
jgi:hypothetical protein